VRRLTGVAVYHFEAARLPLEMQWLKTFQVHVVLTLIAFHDRKAANSRASGVTIGGPPGRIRFTPAGDMK
jgi:hypothetical protein